KALTLSELNELDATGQLTDQRLMDAANSPTMTTTDMNNFLANHYARQGRENQKQKSINELLPNFDRSFDFGNASHETQNATYDQLVAHGKERYPDSGPLEVESKIVANAGGEVKKFTSMLNNMAISANPDDIRAADNAIVRISDQRPQNLQSLTPESSNFIAA